MKRIGILGGTSYPSTILYYETLNRLYNDKFRAFHSCPILLYSIDYHDIKSNYNDGWDVIPQLLKKELQVLLNADPSCVMIANNTLHKAFDLIKHELEINVPVFHIIELTKEYILDKKYKNVLLLGTRYTMESDFFKAPLIEAGINVVIPEEEERIQIQNIQIQLSAGKPVTAEFIDYFEELNQKYGHLDAFILGCTEIPLLYKAMNDVQVNLIDTLQIQCEKAMSVF
ncbi:aspartate racemase [Elizabethkingia meningoseptica]|uniref:aspartate/glutamate racemase family protein n=1 Tax=Elizabethkingia meningoseptica TaxID=238 RepID=UPI000332CEAA|nr:amino acid racemase [Elizabethkingia meningoseptica]AQX03771.1 aspartate racemase [Elizabethkingia meningoseptica]AQX45810.1 aspartate racemase [Elizabethkingia meningoseptica]EOR28849.1 aspartate racemase [Elizabethkingia meningoseptica ATCC 13253 = NBRC 12535]KUY15103.1 aspartate racemase [Elizabethkingia meningoseptica]MCL1674125.1 amino acid racemase [Elizabethkingia meningoseptica]